MLCYIKIKNLKKWKHLCMLEIKTNYFEIQNFTKKLYLTQSDIVLDL